LVKEFLKELGVTIKVKKQNIPNAETIAAMNELKAGKGKRFKNADEHSIVYNVFNDKVIFICLYYTSLKKFAT
jgi:hypothetical protein